MRPNLMKKVVIAQFAKVLPYLPLYAAKRYGFFEREGLDVTIMNAFGDHSTWGMIRKGDAQFGVADPLMMVEDNTVRGIVVAALVQRAGIYGMSKHQHNTLVDARSFSGRSVAVFRSPSTSFALLSSIRRDCIKLGGDEPRLIEMEPTTELGYLARPDSDIVMMTEPSASVAELEGAHRIFHGSKYFGQILVTGLFARKDYVDINPSIARGVVSGIDRSLRMLHKDHIEAIRVARQEFSHLPAMAVEMATLRLFADQMLPESSIASDSAWYALRHIRSADSGMPLFHSYVDNSFALGAAQTPKRAQEILSLKPGIWGISVDLKAIWRNLRRLRQR